VGRRAPVRLLGRAIEGILSIAALAGLAGLVLFGRGALGISSLTPTSDVGLAAGAAASLTPSELTLAGATLLEAAHAKGAGGIGFEIVQTATLHAKANGPKIDIPDPNSRGSLGLTDEYEVASTIEHGTYTSDGFWMEMRDGPKPGGKPDFDHATYQFGAIVKAGKTYRNDGKGWYVTDQPPGIGLDPATVALLPTLLRNATNPMDAGTGSLDGVPVRNLTAGTKVADIPGIVAVDGADFTSIASPVKLAFDDLGRLVQLSVTAQNTNETRYDLLIDTVITFAYPPSAAPIPDPDPTLGPPPPAQKG
jgi:hypothetical protein